MKYLKALFFSFLIVFFANHVLPGIVVNDITKLPHIGGDLLFSILLGLLNSLIYPILKVLHRPITLSRIGLIALALNFIAYGVVKFLPVGIQITSVEGYLLAALAVSIGSFLLNYYEMKHSSNKPIDPMEPKIQP